MRTSNHTPGPWRLGSPFNGFIWGPDPTRGDTSGANWPIANVESIRGSTRFSEADEANARLIASAPDLLAALEDIIAKHGQRMKLDFARAAIAKAKGETK